MADLNALWAAVLARKGQEGYLTQMDAFMVALMAEQATVRSALYAVVSGVSTTSLTIGPGNHTMNVGTGKKVSVGDRIKVANAADKLMIGTAVGYTDSGAGALEFSVADAADTIGAGTYASWTWNVIGDEGDAGPVWLNPSLKTGAATFAANNWFLAKLSATADFTLPTSPAANTLLRITDIAGNFSTHAPRLLRNGQTIMGLAEDFTMTRDRAGYFVIFSDGTWQVIRAN